MMMAITNTWSETGVCPGSEQRTLLVPILFHNSVRSIKVFSLNLHVIFPSIFALRPPTLFDLEKHKRQDGNSHGRMERDR